MALKRPICLNNYTQFFSFSLSSLLFINVTFFSLSESNLKHIFFLVWCLGILDWCALASDSIHSWDVEIFICFIESQDQHEWCSHLSSSSFSFLSSTIKTNLVIIWFLSKCHTALHQSAPQSALQILHWISILTQKDRRI